MNDKNEEIEIIYKSNGYGGIKLFGSNFVVNNKYKCKIIYNNYESELKEYLDCIKGEIKIKLKGINNITNMSYMFSGCNSLSSLSDISKVNTSKITNMTSMFRECKTLSSLPDISKMNTSNVIDMSWIFYECNSLSSLSDISKWITSNVTNMSYIFSWCNSLSSLPDI